MTTQLTKHFTLEEMTHSDTAIKHGISNMPSPEHLANLENYTAPMFEIVRDIVGEPVHLTNAYRAPKVNALVGGTPTSAHPLGFAGDGKVASMSAEAFARKLVPEIRNGRLKGKVDQMILESGRGVVHLSADPRKNREGHPRGMMGHQPGGPGTPIDWNYFS